MAIKIRTKNICSEISRGPYANLVSQKYLPSSQITNVSGCVIHYDSSITPTHMICIRIPHTCFSLFSHQLNNCRHKSLKIRTKISAPNFYTPVHLWSVQMFAKYTKKKWNRMHNSLWFLHGTYYFVDMDPHWRCLVYVNSILNTLLHNIHSYLQDSTHFLRIANTVGILPTEGIFLVTMDTTSPFYLK